MKLKKAFLLFIILGTWVGLVLPGMTPEGESIYGHVSFVEEQAMVIRSDQAQHKAVVNLPLVPGDTVLTGGDGRCELQFDNGTVIRMDKNSRLRLTTVQAPTLTSSWKVSTLHLLQGQLYVLPQTYNQELFQIITANAAVKLQTRTAATIRFHDDLGTALFSDAGKFEVLYGAESKTLEKIMVKSGQAYVINTANILAASSEKRNLEFVAWNDYVDRHFKELHFGISKVPPKLKFGNSALRYWAEKWSSRFGEWIYDELFGYVWKPAAEQFANSTRPFFHAEHVRINGQLFLVPQESWGWTPAHMGTWAWLDRGWTWIPGDWFHSGVVDFLGSSIFPTMDYYFLMGYGYDIFRQYGLLSWRLGNLQRYYQEAWEEIRKSWQHKVALDPDPDGLPDKLAKIIRRVDKGPADDVARRLGLDQKLSVMGKDNVAPDKGAKLPIASPDTAGKARPVPELEARREITPVRKSAAVRDWNPDSQWAVGRGYSIYYSSVRNAVICPELNMASDRGSWQRHVGADRHAAPARAIVPASHVQTGSQSTGSADSATPPSSLDKKSDEKGGSGK